MNYVWFYATRKNWVTGEWNRVTMFREYKDAEKFITFLLNELPGEYKIEKVYQRDE